MTINEKQDQIIEDFSISDDWFDRYAMLIDMGQELKALPEDKKTPENRGPYAKYNGYLSVT